MAEDENQSRAGASLIPSVGAGTREIQSAE